MKNFIIISVIYLLLFVPNLKSQTVAPLEFGNVWVYDLISNLSRITVVDTSVYFDSVAFYKLFYEDNYGILDYFFYARLREDGFYVRYSEFDSTETPYYKKGAVVGDTWTVGILVYSIEDTFVANVFGEQTTIKHLLADDGLIYRHEYWTEKFGKLSSQDFGGIIDNLLGCVIDGVAYGDTSFILVSVDDEFETPNSFYLAQNYPNPFNPSTTIRYEIPERSFVTIKVYDVLGNEISTLVNDEKPAGEYEVEFNGHSGVVRNLTSGTYFYQLKTENYIETKKMILLK